ncbi:hypothetical protein C7B76_09175 [filamentous cyanobacterium CCP2]|nr:hypothetical protein C7B76_09175 [filamentous cyanobacterium CCP2]
MSQTRLFLDTNILVYAHDASSHHHAISAQLLTAILVEQFRGVLAEQNLFELYRVLTNSVAMRNKPLSALQAKDLIDATYLNGKFEIVYPTEITVHQALDLAIRKGITSAKIFDFRLAALALSAQIDFFVTFNTQDFMEIDGLSSLTPQQIIFP